MAAGVAGCGGRSGELVARQVAYWREQLADLPAEIVLPVDRPRPAAASHRGERVVFTVPAEVHAGVVRLARESRSSVFMVLQAALVLLLSRSGAGEDVPIGTPVAGRGDDAVDDLVGLFINTLVLRTDVSGDPTFRELVGRVRETDLEAYAHQDVPSSGWWRSLIRSGRCPATPLPGHAHVAQSDVVRSQCQHPAPRRTEIHPGHDVARFDLTFEFAMPDSVLGLRGVLTYAVDVFERGSAELLVERLVWLLGVVVGSPDVPVGGVDVLVPGERRRVVEEWNETSVGVAGVSVVGCLRSRWGGFLGLRLWCVVGCRFRMGSWMRGRIGWRGC
ncbi:condensation domain-containing protein [Streptomyces tubbatahanensis]|uniref:condensation domain-containing protein n=1 Tax=Streptomyces tubbatahanensis TaxID=2923272 RepID=UPI00237CB741|nr:condensation domain-containing protein [Streptomyces tubbatahanensis]